MLTVGQQQFMGTQKHAHKNQMKKEMLVFVAHTILYLCKKLHRQIAQITVRLSHY